MSKAEGDDKTMRLLVCYKFSDGSKAYFFKGDPVHHLYVKPGEVVAFHFPAHYMLKQLKIKYSTWLKRLGNNAKLKEEDRNENRRD